MIMCQLLACSWSWPSTLCPPSNCFVSSCSTYRLSLCATRVWFYTYYKVFSYLDTLSPHPFPFEDYVCVWFLMISIYSPVSVVLSWRALPPSQRAAVGVHGPAPAPRGWGAKVVSGCAPCSGRTSCERASHRVEPLSNTCFRNTFKTKTLMVKW